MISFPISMLTMVLNLVWAFKFRNRLNILSGSKKGDMFWLGGVLTFFFQIYYFQYKINEMHDVSNMQAQIPANQ